MNHQSHDVSQSLFDSERFMPHGHCFLWQPEILWTHVISDVLIAVAYASIPLVLIYIVLQRRDIKFDWLVVMFGVFILSCGATHVMNTISMWYPVYFLAGLFKAICAASSIGTAIALAAALPKLMMIPSPKQLEDANSRLAREIDDSRSAREQLATQASQLDEQARELEQFNSRLEETNKHLDQFTSVVAHDLQEPVRKIITYGEMVRKSAGDQLPEKAANRIDRMVSASTRMQTLIQDLLEYSRITHRQLKFTEVDIDGVVADVIENLEDRISRTNGQVEVKGPLPKLDADRSHMWQLFQNIIGNGLKFHRPDVPPVVRISAERLDQFGPDQIPAWKFRITDNGIGIPEEHLARIFGTFERLHGRSEYEGTGIGLSVCKGAVERHGGRIEVTSREGEGSCFEFILPEHQESGELLA